MRTCTCDTPNMARSSNQITRMCSFDANHRRQSRWDCVLIQQQLQTRASKNKGENVVSRVHTQHSAARRRVTPTPTCVLRQPLVLKQEKSGGLKGAFASRFSSSLLAFFTGHVRRARGLQALGSSMDATTRSSSRQRPSAMWASSRFVLTCREGRANPLPRDKRANPHPEKEGPTLYPETKEPTLVFFPPPRIYILWRLFFVNNCSCNDNCNYNRNNTNDNHEPSFLWVWVGPSFFGWGLALPSLGGSWPFFPFLLGVHSEKEKPKRKNKISII